MRARQILTCWDYHHGQATRILTAGHPHVPGATMREKQDHFERHHGDVRAALCREPRGHRNMLGAILTAPVEPGSLAGVLFTSPTGYFDMCGDSTFSLASYLVDSGTVRPEGPGEDGQVDVRIDTVAGPVELEITVRNGSCEAAAMRNVTSYALGTLDLDVAGHGRVTVRLAYGGLVFAFLDAEQLGIDSLLLETLDAGGQHKIVEAGSRLFEAARAAGHDPGIDLVTLTQPLPDGRGERVANFYASGTMGRTPSGTGTSARLAWEHEHGDLPVGEPWIQESGLGLRFTGTVVASGTGPGGRREITPQISARSHLMGIQQIVFGADDPFPAGFTLLD